MFRHKTQNTDQLLPLLLVLNQHKHKIEMVYNKYMYVCFKYKCGVFHLIRDLILQNVQNYAMTCGQPVIHQTVYVLK